MKVTRGSVKGLVMLTSVHFGDVNGSGPSIYCSVLIHLAHQALPKSSLETQDRVPRPQASNEALRSLVITPILWLSICVAFE